MCAACRTASYLASTDEGHLVPIGVLFECQHVTGRDTLRLLPLAWFVKAAGARARQLLVSSVLYRMPHMAQRQLAI